MLCIIFVCASLPDYLSITHFILTQHVCTLIVFKNILIQFDTVGSQVLIAKFNIPYLLQTVLVVLSLYRVVFCTKTRQVNK